MALEMFQCHCGWRMPKRAEKAIAAHEATHAPKRREPVDIEKMIDNAARGIATPEATPIDRMMALNRLLSMTPEEMFERTFRQPILEEMAAADELEGRKA